MTTERELLEQALGSDEPPLVLDFAAIEARGARAVRRRTKLALAGTAAAVVLVGLGGTALLTRGTGQEPQTVTPAAAGQVTSAAPIEREIAYCYRTADITSTEENQHIPFGINGNSANGRGDAAAAAMQICTSTWADNHTGWQQPGLPRVVPPLVACVLTPAAVDVRAGAVGVFPGDAKTCAAMGLPVARI